MNINLITHDRYYIVLSQSPIQCKQTNSLLYTLCDKFKHNPIRNEDEAMQHAWLGNVTPKLQTQRLHIGLQLSRKHSFQDKPKFYPKILHKCLLSSSPFVILGLSSRNSPAILKFMNKNMTHVPLISCVHFIIQAQSYSLEESVILEIKEHDVYVTIRLHQY